MTQTSPVQVPDSLPEGVVLENVNLLLADDDQSTLDLLKYHFDQVGWNGTYVRSATALIRAMNEQCQLNEVVYDAVIADINYWNVDDGPKITGITAAREIRKIMPNIPIVFITAFSNSVLREEIRRVRGEILVKPFEFEHLYAKLSQMIHWHRMSHRTNTKPERRIRSVNISQHKRRSTDKFNIAPSEIIQKAIKEVKESK